MLLWLTILAILNISRLKIKTVAIAFQVNVKTEDGQFDIEIPRDKHNSFEPQLVKKKQTQFTSVDDNKLSLYPKSISPYEIGLNVQ